MAWNSVTAGPNWNPDADLDSDGIVGPEDYTIFGSFWYSAEPWQWSGWNAPENIIALSSYLSGQIETHPAASAVSFI